MMSDICVIFHFGRTKNFCSTIVIHIVVGNFCKNVRWFYLKFLRGVFNRTLSIHVDLFVLEPQVKWHAVTQFCIQQVKVGGGLLQGVSRCGRGCPRH